jgi:phage baseplate assembly protein W
MRSFLKIPVTFVLKGHEEALENATVEDSVRQYIDLLISTKQGECAFNHDFGYEIWSNEFEPILNVQQWQPRFMEQIKYLLDKYEHRIYDVQVKEPEIKSINKKRKTDKDYRITISLDYTIRQTGERQNNIKVSFEY